MDIRKYLILAIVICFAFTMVPVLAVSDGTIIEDVSSVNNLEVNMKMTPLLMDKVMEFDEDEEISVIIIFKDTGKLTKMHASVSSV
ncbi:MAG: hypothetical protein GOV02_02500, partial [Candidatus Aenigmarchaeota archaeon]|nr:hypothetical protein [Candidatus Aenigmarchaeota archaeon]